MPYIITSDIHGEGEGIMLIKRAASHYKAEGILSAGDQCPRDDDPFWKSLIAVRGNCDRFYEYGDIPFPPLSRREEIYGRTIVMTHGDRMYTDDFDLKIGDIFISGHTHVPVLKEENGIYIVNPGSPSRPRSSSGPTAVLFDALGLCLFSLLDLTILSKLAFSSSNASKS